MVSLLFLSPFRGQINQTVWLVGIIRGGRSNVVMNLKEKNAKKRWNCDSWPLLSATTTRYPSEQVRAGVVVAMTVESHCERRERGETGIFPMMMVMIDQRTIWEDRPIEMLQQLPSNPFIHPSIRRPPVCSFVQLKSRR